MKLAIYNHGIAFDGNTVADQPLGGSESGIIYMARELAGCGHQVQVYSNCPNPGVYDDVEYLHYHRFFSDYRTAPWDAVIAFRSFDPMLLGRIAPRMIFWTGDSHDQPGLQHFGHAALQQHIDRIFCVSNWHRDTFIRRFGLDPAKVAATRNGFASHLRGPYQERSATRSAYTSTPFRGLGILLEMFPQIRSRVPSATLSLFSSMKVYGWSSDDDRKNFGALYESANQAGVSWHGSIRQPELLQELGRTGLLLYPNTFEETSCIAAIEAQASGCVVVTSARAALNETVAHGETGFCIEGDPHSESYRRRFIEAACALMTNNDLFRRMSAAACARASRSYTWASIAREWTHTLESIPSVPVSGRHSGPLSLLERAQEYVHAGNSNAARRVIATLQATPFFSREAEQLISALDIPLTATRTAHGGA